MYKPKRPGTHTHARARKHTHRNTQICNIYCFSTATTIRERASVLLYMYTACLVTISHMQHVLHRAHKSDCNNSIGAHFWTYYYTRNFPKIAKIINYFTLHSECVKILITFIQDISLLDKYLLNILKVYLGPYIMLALTLSILDKTNTREYSYDRTDV
jgi:hypothetical protein